VYYVYALKSIKRKYIYIGITDNIQRRFNQHQSGNNKTTSAYRPFKIILIEKFKNRLEARKREKYLKSGMGREWIKKIHKYK